MNIQRATLLVFMLLVIITTSETKNLNYNFMDSEINVFKIGDFETNTTSAKKGQNLSPPNNLFIVSPIKEGKYPVFLFVHGTMIDRFWYSDIFQHIASHGFIVVAPQIYPPNLISIPSQPKEIEDTVSVANWLDPNLDNTLPQGVKGDLTKLTISGHSRGAKTAFAIALGVHKTQLKVPISALVAISPVAGSSKYCRTEPHILTYEPNSFDLSIPVTIIGSGLGHDRKCYILPPCAPDGVSHDEFYNECKNATHFVLSEYGHNDLLNDGQGKMVKAICVCGKSSCDPLRKSVGGIVVAFLEFAYKLHGFQQFSAILNDPSVAPIKLYPVEMKVDNQEESKFAYY